MLEVKETYDAHFSADLSTGDVEALKRRAENVTRDAFSVFTPVPAAEGDASPGWAETTYHVVRLTAQSQAHARTQVTDALQREPDNLTLRRAPNFGDSPAHVGDVDTATVPSPRLSARDRHR